ncbi:MAG: BREX system P-loop protein BrxC [Desulfobacterales bacterium]|nr:BREX system P-loop protein BrxC [Desulfobacterales bacterium]
MKNRDIYQRDPDKITLLNNGVVAMTDVLTREERRTLRFELEHFVCEGEYKRGLARILDTYVSNTGQPEQPAAWISGFFGSGKSHLAKMLHHLWIDYTFPEDGATARGLARLPEEVKDHLTEISTLGKRYNGLHAASGTLGAGAGDSVRLSLLGIVFRSAGLPESYPQARFCIWLRKNGLYDQVYAEVEAAGRDFRKELNDLYVSPVIAKALLSADSNFAADEKEAKGALRAQFPKPKDISTEEFVQAMQDALAPDGKLPCSVIILDEIQQYIGDDTNRSYIVQEVVEACSKRFGANLLFVGTGQTALSGTPALQRLQGRFTVNIELSDHDVETVIRRVVLAKRADRINDVKKCLDSNAGEIDRQLKESKIGPRSEDRAILVEDYPLLPVRRRFWENTLRAVDKAGTAGQLRTQLRIVYDAIRKTADAPLGTVVAADFLFDEISPNLLQSGVLLREIDEIIRQQDDTTENGRLKSRLCALVFVIRKLPREAAVDIGVRATPEMLADLLVENLTRDGAHLRSLIPGLLDELVTQGALMRLEDEYSLQTKESSEWEQEFRGRETKLLNDTARMASKRGQMLAAACQQELSAIKPLHGKCKVQRKLLLHFGPDAPAENKQDIPVWIRDEWGEDEKNVLADARAAGPDSPVINIFIPRTQAEAIKKRIAEQDGAEGTLHFKGVPTTREGIEAREAMQTRLAESSQRLTSLIKEIIDSAKVFQGGGNERLELSLADKLIEAVRASLDRMFPDFRNGDDARWNKVIARARGGSESPLAAIDFKDKVEKHPVCAAVLAHVGSGRKGKEIRACFEAAPYGWPRDAVDGALIALFATGQIVASRNSVPLKPKELDQNKIPVTDFRTETTTISARDRIRLRGLFQAAGISCKPNEEGAAAGQFLQKLMDLAGQAGGQPPLPEPPKTTLLADLQTMAGNEQLAGVLQHHDTLKQNTEDWAAAGDLAGRRLPSWRQLQELLEYASGQPFAEPIRSQSDAIATDRRLLDASNPLPDLIKSVVDGLRTALTTAESTYNTAYDQGMAALTSAESWQKLDEDQQQTILKNAGLGRIDKGAVGNADEVLASLSKINLESWATSKAALTQQFAEARCHADKLFEPKTQHISLFSDTLKTREDIEAWIEDTRSELLARIEDGPIVIT